MTPRRFIADCMLGKLAKRLRMLGFDTAYERRIDDATLVRRAVEQGRTLLTRDTRLVQRRALKDNPAGFLLVTSEQPEEQIREVFEHFGLRPARDRLLTICLRCNLPIEPVAAEHVRELVPPYVHATQKRFSRCPGCGRVYWRATHVESMMARLQRRLTKPS